MLHEAPESRGLASDVAASVRDGEDQVKVDLALGHTIIYSSLNIRRKTQPPQKPGPWERVRVNQLNFKKESPVPMFKSPKRSLSSASGPGLSPDHNTTRSNSPLSDLSSDEESDEKPPTLSGHASKLARRMRQVYIPGWALRPLVCKRPEEQGTDGDTQVWYV